MVVFKKKMVVVFFVFFSGFLGGKRWISISFFVMRGF